ncbi:hypothetical protein T484DRAFT_1894060, partial [Baffinella frigidus]
MCRCNKLPFPWVKRTDPRSEEVTYLHPPTGVARDAFLRSVEVNTPEEVQVTYLHPATGVVRREMPQRLPLGWTMHLDRASGKVYYYNRRSGESRWRCPAPKRRPGLEEKQPKEEWVGELLAIQDGKLHVQWLEGTRTWVKPSDVWVVSNEGEGGWEEESEESDWETLNGGSDAGEGGADEANADGLERGDDEANADGLERGDVLDQMERVLDAGGMASMADAVHFDMAPDDEEEEDGDDEDEEGGAPAPEAHRSAGTTRDDTRSTPRVDAAGA